MMLTVIMSIKVRIAVQRQCSCPKWGNGCWQVKHSTEVHSDSQLNMIRYHKGIFTRISPTIGVEFLTKKIILENGIVVKAQIWDTSGSERDRSITTGHYRSAVGALLVFDLSDRETFDQLPYWLNCLREHADENLVVALVGNHCFLDCHFSQQM